MADAEGLDEDVRAANRRTVDYLMGYSANNGLDAYSARDILENGEPAIQRHRDLLHQINQRDPKRAHDFAWGILGHLPEDRQQDFMGFEVPKRPPVGLRRDEWRRTLEVRPDDPVIPPKAEPYNPDKDTGKGIMLLSDEGGEPQSSPPPETGDGEAPRDGQQTGGQDAGKGQESPPQQDRPEDAWPFERAKDADREGLPGYTEVMQNNGNKVDSSGQNTLTKEQENVIKKAKDWVGTPYAPDKPGNPLKGPGARKNEGADCSGSIHAIYGEAGLSYKYKSSGQFVDAAKKGDIPFKEIKPEESRPGDVLVWPGRHMSIDAGDGRVYSARREGEKFGDYPVSGFTKFFQGQPRYFSYDFSRGK